MKHPQTNNLIIAAAFKRKLIKDYCWASYGFKPVLVQIT